MSKQMDEERTTVSNAGQAPDRSLGAASCSAHGDLCDRRPAGCSGTRRAGPGERDDRIVQNKRRRNEHLPLPEGLGQIVATGYAQGAPSGESFSLESSEGTIDTVEVSSSTNLHQFRPAEPSLSDVKIGDYITVFGNDLGHRSDRRPC